LKSSDKRRQEPQQKEQRQEYQQDVTRAIATATSAATRIRALHKPQVKHFHDVLLQNDGLVVFKFFVKISNYSDGHGPL